MTTFSRTSRICSHVRSLSRKKKSLGIKLPLVLDVVKDEDMIETIRAGKHIIIAVPIKDIQSSGETAK